MGNKHTEEIGLGYGHKRMDSLEENVSVFFPEDFADESDRSFEDEDDYESDHGFHDPMERAIFWESQEALLQVFNFNYNNLQKKREEIIIIITKGLALLPFVLMYLASLEMNTNRICN
jgi:hypothetical protein